MWMEVHNNPSQQYRPVVGRMNTRTSASTLKEISFSKEILRKWTKFEENKILKEIWRIFWEFEENLKEIRRPNLPYWEQFCF